MPPRHLIAHFHSHITPTPFLFSRRRHYHEFTPKRRWSILLSEHARESEEQEQEASDFNMIIISYATLIEHCH